MLKKEMEAFDNGELWIRFWGNKKLTNEEVEEMEVVTVSGWVMEEVLERIPAKGDVGTWQNLEVTVLEMDENRVEKIKLVINEEAASEE